MAEEATNKHKPVVPVDPAKPFFVVFYQTETRNVMEIVQTDTPREDADARASDLARSTKRRVLVIGPQRAAFAPPAEVQKDELSFNL